MKERDPAVQLVGVQPVGPDDPIAGLKHLASAEALAVYEPGLVDRELGVPSQEAEATARRLAQEEGLFVGISAGAAVAAAIRVARGIDRGLVVALLPDGGFKYASAPFWVA
jgi:cysteine synthase B